jgi:hypothetical protein
MAVVISADVINQTEESARAATRGREMTKRTHAAFDELRAAIFEMHVAVVENDSMDGVSPPNAASVA